MKGSVLAIFLASIWLIVLLEVSLGIEPSKVQIDLISGRINGKGIIATSIDDVTDLLGRPSRMEKIQWIRRELMELSYFDLGIQLFFNYPNGPQNEECTEILIHLTDRNIFNDTRQFQPFQGTLTHGLDKNWKVRRVKFKFHDFRIFESYDQTLEKEYERVANFMSIYKERFDSRDRGILRDIYMELYNIEVVAPIRSIYYYYEAGTMFIETVKIKSIVSDKHRAAIRALARRRLDKFGGHGGFFSDPQ